MTMLASYQAAKTELDSAKMKLAGFKQSRDFQEQMRLWSEFLTDFDRIFNKLKVGYKNGPTNAWFGKINNERNGDKILSYLMQARNANEHGILPITQHQKGKITIGDPGERVFIKNLRIDDRGISGNIISGTVRQHPEELILVPVMNRGQSYDPPLMSIFPIPKYHNPVSAGEYGIAFMERIMSEAEEKLPK